MMHIYTKIKYEAFTLMKIMKSTQRKIKPINNGKEWNIIDNQLIFNIYNVDSNYDNQ